MKNNFIKYKNLLIGAVKKKSIAEVYKIEFLKTR